MAKEFMNVKQREKKMVHVAEQDFDCGFIPSGIEIPLLDEMNAQTEKQGTYNLPDDFADLSVEAQAKAMLKSSTLYTNEHRAETRNDNIRFVSVFTSFFDQDYTEEFLSKNASGAEISKAVVTLQETIARDYYGTINELNSGNSGKKAGASAKKKKK